MARELYVNKATPNTWGDRGSWSPRAHLPASFWRLTASQKFCLIEHVLACGGGAGSGGRGALRQLGSEDRPAGPRT